MRRLVALLTILLHATLARALSTSLSNGAGNMSRRHSAASSDGGIVTGTAGWLQKTITIIAPSRGCHIITHEIEKQMPALSKFQVMQYDFFCDFFFLRCTQVVSG
jgi:hypothetical protein